MVMGRQFHAPPVLLKETTPNTNFIEGYVALRTGLNAVETRKSHTPEIEP
jgi:hypothetical protein